MKNKIHSDLVKSLKYLQSQHRHAVCEIQILKDTKWDIWQPMYEYQFYHNINYQIGEWRWHIRELEYLIREIKRQIKQCQRN